MTEYTSHDVTARLIAAGFTEPPDTRVVDVDVLPWRSDTLLAWLIDKEYQVSVGHSYDKKRYTAFYTNERGEHNTRRELADTVPDALAEVILKVRGVSK
jgi:hypothetical protein